MINAQIVHIYHYDRPPYIIYSILTLFLWQMLYFTTFQPGYIHALQFLIRSETEFLVTSLKLR